MIIDSTLDTYLNQCNCLMLWIMLQWRSLVCRLRMCIHISIGFVLPNYFLGSGDQVIYSQNLCKLLSDWGHFQLDTLFVIFKLHREHGWILKTCLRYLMTVHYEWERLLYYFSFSSQFQVWKTVSLKLCSVMSFFSNYPLW